MIDEDISAGRTCFPLKYIYEKTCQRNRHFGDDTGVNLTRQKDLVIERFPVLTKEIWFRREVMLVPTSAMNNLATTSLCCKNSSHDCRALLNAALICRREKRLIAMTTTTSSLSKNMGLKNSARKRQFQITSSSL